MQALLNSLGPRDFFLERRVTDRHAVRSDDVSVDTSFKCNYNVPCMMKFSQAYWDFRLSYLPRPAREK